MADAVRAFQGTFSALGLVVCASALLLAEAEKAAARTAICFFELQSADPSTYCRQVIAGWAAEWHATREGQPTMFGGESRAPARLARVEIHAHAEDSNSPIMTSVSASSAVPPSRTSWSA